MFEFVKVETKYYESIKDYRKQMLEVKSSFDGCFNLLDYEDIEKWDLNNKLFESPDTCPPGYSIGYEYLYVDDNQQVIGMVNLRPEALSHPFLKQYGGHIGYSVKPTLRKQGIGKQLLKDFLPICKNEYQLNKILITCKVDNIGSRKIILANGGLFESEIFYAPENKMLQRYWISL